jgi:hypothetical protein
MRGEQRHILICPMMIPVVCSHLHGRMGLHLLRRLFQSFVDAGSVGFEAPLPKQGQSKVKTAARQL